MLGDTLRLRLLERTYPDAVFVSALRRETTRPLIERIARELATKWDASARGPNLEPGEPVEAAPREHVDESEVTTLDQMLRRAGKRVRSLA